MRHYALVCGYCVMVALGQGMIHRAQAQDQNTVDSARAGLEEIVVTAQKRVENLQNVPISVQVVSGKTLSDNNFNSLDSLTQTIPDVHVGSSAGSFSNDLYIRGIGSGIGGGNVGFDQSVAMFADDIYHGRSRLSGATFLDLDRLEVLKGPQSTFFGNNAIAGALNIVTAKPGDVFEGWGRALYGMYGTYAAEGAVTLPIDDTLSMRAAATFNGGRGWIKNIDTGKDAPDTENKAGRITMAYKPTTDLDVTFKIEGSDNSIEGTSGNQPLQWTNCPAVAPIGTSGNCAYALANHFPIGLDNDENVGLPGQGSHLSTFEDVLTVNYRQWGRTLTSVTGFYNYHFSANNDVENLGIDNLTNQMIEKYNQFSQELRIASSTGGAIEYLAGLYFQSDNLAEVEPVDAPFLSFLGPLLGVPAADLPFAWHPNFSQGEHVYSVFGSLGWNATDALRFNAGVRGSWVYKNFYGDNEYGIATQEYGGFVPIPLAIQQDWSPVEGAPGTESVSRSDHAWMPSGGIQYQLNPTTMAYATYTRGFKAGGFNGITPNAANLQFAPEHVNAYELGIKSKWLNDTVLLNADVFRGDYKDLQANAYIYNPITTAFTEIVNNAAASRSQGVELEAQWAVTKDLRFSANATYLESTYIDYPDGGAQTLQNYCASLSHANFLATPQCIGYGYPVSGNANLSGQSTNFAPRWSGSLAASYRLLLPGDYQLTTLLSPYITSVYNNQDPYLPSVGGYVRLDARLTFEPAHGHWAVDLIGKNVTDRVIATSANAKEEPANVALQVRGRW